MNHILASLDQWSLSVLMGICTLFGVKELPQLPDPHWKVEQQWEKQPDGYYLLVLSSETIQDQCRNGSAKYIVFPQTYMAVQEVFADGIKVYTNEMGKRWHLKSFLDRPAVGCDLIGFAKRIEFRDLSYQKFFASISNWPRAISGYPAGQMFYTTIYTVVAILAAVAGVIFFAIAIFLGEKGYHILFLSFAIFMIMLSHYSEHFFVMHVDYSHQLAIISLLMLCYSLLFVEHFYTVNIKSYLILLFIIVFETFTSYGYQHTAQLYIHINCGLSLSLMWYYSFKKNVNRNKKIALLLTAIFGTRDFYESQIDRSGFFHLSLLCLVLIFFMSYQLILKIYEKNLKHEIEKETILSDKRIAEKIREINSKTKQVLHDMKSPITSLNFLTESGSFTKENIQLPLNRLNDLVKNVFGRGADYLADWYSEKILDNAIRLIVEEKKNIVNNVSYSSSIDGNFFAFFDPDLVKVIVAELIDNSVKNNNRDVHISIQLTSLQNGKVEIFYSDDGIGLSNDDKVFLGLLGNSKTGSGLGVNTLIKRLEEVGATFKLKQNEGKKGYACVINFLKK